MEVVETDKKVAEALDGGTKAQSSKMEVVETDKKVAEALDGLYDCIMFENENTKLQEVLLSSSYPSPISLKLQGIQEMLKGYKGRMDTDSINFAIRKLRREETIDRRPTNSQSLVRKYYFSADFVRLASEDNGQSDLETCVRNDFGQVADLFCHSKKEVLCIPVLHDDGCWSLYAFNMSDQKLSILDPTAECAFRTNHQKCSILDSTAERVGRVATCESRDKSILVHELANKFNFCGFLSLPESVHDKTRLKICKALGSVKDKFNLFKNTSSDFSSWRYELTDLKSNICTSEDSGFVVFYFMLSWDGTQFSNTVNIPKEPKELREGFLKYIVSSNYNEVYHQLDDLRVLELMEKFWAQQASAGRPALTRCKMDTRLLKAVRENSVDEFDEILDQKSNETMRQMIICLGATCGGDGVLHIAARYGKSKLMRAIFKRMDVYLNLEDMERQLKSALRDDSSHREHGTTIGSLLSGHSCLSTPSIWKLGDMWKNSDYVKIGNKGEEHQQKLVMLLRSRNHKGETCLHEAVRRDNTLLALSLILVDNEMSDDDSSPLPLVQRVDYEGVSPLYLAATLCRSDIVGILTHENNRHKASFSGPGGKTALHAAILLNKGLTQHLLNWMKHVKRVPDPTIMADNSGNTPLHLVSSVRGGADIAEILISSTPGDKEPLATSSAAAPKDKATYSAAALMKDSKGWLPIHVAAANGTLCVIKQMMDKCPECIESRNARGQSFLHVAVEKKRRNVVRYVCSQQSLAGILNLTDQDGNTALHLAVETGNQRMFCDLMANPSVCLNSANREGWTPLAVAWLSLGAELRFTMSSRVLIYYHLKRCGAHYGTCRRDVLMDEIAGKVDKDKMSEAFSKSAGLLAVCAIFILNMSVTTFFNMAKQNLALTDPKTAAARPADPSDAEGSVPASARVLAFKYLMAADAITFAAALLAALCSTFAGFSTMDRPARLLYLNIATSSLQIACLGLVAIFILAAYLAFVPVDLNIATAACVLPFVAIIPQLVAQTSVMLRFALTLLRRRFQKHFFPKLGLFFETYFPAPSFTRTTTTTVSPATKATMEAIWTCLLTPITYLLLTPIKSIMRLAITILGGRMLLPVGVLVVAYLPVRLFYITYQHKS